MEKYHVQCAGCCCTLYAEALEEGEEWEYTMTGELCSQREEKEKEKEEQEQEEMNDDYYDID